MSAPAIISRLVDTFHANINYLKSSDYDEAKVRNEFVNKFFIALGWDVTNETRRGDVVYEARVKIDGKVKRPDYGFCIGGQPRFFVETKSPVTKLEHDKAPALQLRRYGWSAGLPVSVLTDFEEFFVYDCRVPPGPQDSTSKCRRQKYHYEQYADRWDEIASLFSYDAVRSNRLEAFVEAIPERETIPVDDAFLKTLEQWRVLLAQDIARLNPQLTWRQLNMAVQTTLDRIVFLRICEDRGIEPYARLHSLIQGPDTYSRLLNNFHQADARYNSGLFHFRSEAGREAADTLTPKLNLSDQALHYIISKLYGDECPYAFDYIPADILGQIYERFLGQIIEVNADREVQIVAKPEVRKAGGVFYTPPYIVNHIVESTLGPLLARKTPVEVAQLRILDPACGSGSFLLSAFTYLIDWHRRWYEQHDPDKQEQEERLRSYPVPDGEKMYALTVGEKRRILLNNLYGVDLDQQAVEVTKLSLLLRVLEDETAKTLQLELLPERVLPDLAENIRWGNSLIGPEFYQGQTIPLFDIEELYRVKAFDWHSKTAGFGAIMAAGGFDAVIGNPPYIRIQTLNEWASDAVAFYKKHYQTAHRGNYDIYVIFVERALQLLSAKGRAGFILPHKFLNTQYGEPLRRLLASGQHLSRLVHFGHEQVFEEATTYTCLLFLSKAAAQQFEFMRVADLKAWRTAGQVRGEMLPASRLSVADWNLGTGDSAQLFDRLQAMPVKLRDVAARIGQGIRTSANEVYVVDMRATEEGHVRVYSSQLQQEVDIERGLLSTFLQGRDIKPFYLNEPRKAVIIPYRLHQGHLQLISESILRQEYPLTLEYLIANRAVLENRERGRMRGENWYAFIYPKNIDLMKSCKIMVPDIAARASFALDAAGGYAFTSGYGITLQPTIQESQLYLLGLLNSRVLNFYLHQISTSLRGGYIRYFTQYMEQLPIRQIVFDDSRDVARHNRMVECVSLMLDLHKQLAAAPNDVVTQTIRVVIDATERDMNALVYELYGLTDKEITLIENGAPVG